MLLFSSCLYKFGKPIPHTSSYTSPNLAPPLQIRYREHH